MKQYLNFSNHLLTVMLKVTCMMGNRTVVAVQTLQQQDHYYTHSILIIHYNNNYYWSCIV